MEFITYVANTMIYQIHSFAPFLRENGFKAGASESIEAVRALTEIHLESMEQVMYTLRSIYASNSAEWTLFPSLFKRHFYVFQHKLQTPKEFMEVDEVPQRSSILENIPLSNQLEGARFPSYSPSLGQKYPIKILHDENLAHLLKWTKQAVLQIESPRSRRFKQGSGHRIDQRNTLKKALKNGGEPFKLSFRKNRKALPNVVIAIDISGSMKDYADFYLTIAWTFIQAKARVEVLLFSTDIKRITPFLHNRFLKGITLEKIMDLKGGTRIGYSMSRLTEKYASILRQKTCFIVISDGFDTGDPKLLFKSMDQLSKKVGQIIWFNPLLGEKEYEPISTGMRTALPFLTAFVDVHDHPSWIKAVKSNSFANH